MSIDFNRIIEKAEAVLTGVTQRVDSNEEAILILDYICNTLDRDITITGKEIFEIATNNTTGAEIKAVCADAIMNGKFFVVTLPMSTNEDKEPFELLNEWCHCYVYNFEDPEDRGHQLCYFEETDVGIERIL